MEQVSIFEIIQKQTQYLQDNPHLLDKLVSYGISPDSLYSSDYREGHESGYFEYIGAISTLEDRRNYTTEAWKIFDDSDVGKAYRDAKIHPKIALKYINDIMLNLYP
jgi:hypothetical protein